MVSSVASGYGQPGLPTAPVSALTATGEPLRPPPSGAALRRAPWPTLEAVLAPAYPLGVRRLIRITHQLASELSLAERAGITLRRVAPDTLRVERANSAFERARLSLSVSEGASSVQDGVRGLGLMISRILASKPLYLDASLGSPPQRIVRRRADAEVVEMLARALAAIARRCAARDPRYRDLARLCSDLAKLEALAHRVAEQKRTPPPIVAFAHPRPRAAAKPELPKVIIQ